MHTVIARLAGTLLLVAAALAIPAQTANADVLDVTCTGSQTTTYSPALTLTPTSGSRSIATNYGPCISNDVASGFRVVDALPYTDRTCLNLLDATSFTYDITWNTGQTTTVQANSNVQMVGAALITTIHGVVIDGLYDGGTVLQVNTGVSLGVTQCTLGIGSVSSIFSTVVLEIT